MQHDCLGQDNASIVQNREVSLVRRSDKYMFLWPCTHLRPSMAVRITEVSLIRSPVIKRFHCTPMINTMAMMIYYAMLLIGVFKFV